MTGGLIPIPDGKKRREGIMHPTVEVIHKQSTAQSVKQDVSLSINFLSWLTVAYCLMAGYFENGNWIFPLSYWLVEPSIVTVFLIVSFIIFLTKVTHWFTWFVVPVNLYMAYTFLRLGGIF